MPEQVKLTKQQAKEAVALILILAETAEEAKANQLNLGPSVVKRIKDLARRVKENR